MTHASTFTLPSYRQLCKYLGETDAMVELTELSARYFLDAATVSGNISEFVQRASDTHQICVNLAEVAQLSNHLSRSYIVTVYQSAERFLHEFREEHIELFGNEWTGDGVSVDPLSVAMKNLTQSSEDAMDRLGEDLVSRFQYYRSVRNWIVHTKESDLAKPLARYEQITPMAGGNADLLPGFNMPNRPDSLSFDDFVLFSRVAKAIAYKMCVIATPSIEDWRRFFETGALRRFNKFSPNRDRVQSAVCAQLRTEYGMDEATARWISKELSGALV